MTRLVSIILYQLRLRLVAGVQHNQYTNTLLIRFYRRRTQFGKTIAKCSPKTTMGGMDPPCTDHAQPTPGMNTTSPTTCPLFEDIDTFH